MRSPRVSAPGQTKRAPPSSSMSAMGSRERKPSGAALSVVNETTWPTPRTVVGVIGTGCHGHHVAGGATTASHRGHRDASMVSIMGSPRTAGTRSQARLASRPRLALPSPLRLYDRDPVVRRKAADRVGERDLAGDL